MELTEKKGWDEIDGEADQNYKKAKVELISFLRDLDSSLVRIKILV